MHGFRVKRIVERVVSEVYYMPRADYGLANVQIG